MTNFSDFSVKRIRPPASGQKRHWDTSLPGFGLRVSQGGAKTWIVLDPRSKTRTQETIGRYPLISLADARNEARRRLAEQTLGKHRPRQITWNRGRDEYLREIEARRKPRTHADYKRMLHLHFKFADTRLCDLSPHDIQKRLDRLNDTPSEHHHAFAVLRAFLNWAHQKHYVGEHPMARMKSPSVGKPRARILTDEELKAVWKACGDDTHSTIVRLLILTGQRKGEIAALTQAMIGADNITLPAWLTKNSREHIFPLPALTASVVASSVARVRSLKKSEPIFGVTVGDSRKRFSAWSKCKARLDVDAAVTGWTLHDLRRTFASGLAGQGVGLPVIEKILNHVSGSFAGIVGVYQRYDFQPEMRAALEKWERHLQTISA